MKLSSLNLAQAVQIMTYELHQSLIGPQEKQPEHSQDLPATIEQIHYFENHLEMTAENINLIKGSQTIRHLRQIFHSPDDGTRSPAYALIFN